MPDEKLNPNQVSGAMYLYLNGTLLPTDGEGSVDSFGEPVPEEVLGPDGYLGPRFKPKAARIKGTVIDNGSVDLDTLKSATDVTVVIETDTGRRFTMNNATKANGLSYDQDGKVPVEFMGAKVDIGGTS